MSTENKHQASRPAQGNFHGPLLAQRGCGIVFFVICPLDSPGMMSLPHICYVLFLFL